MRDGALVNDGDLAVCSLVESCDWMVRPVFWHQKPGVDDGEEG
ncbi:MAG: hypothetical protein RDV48_20535 [Candidatus Eremiobacteraeota bacterium]|nr:hypothetical protein [Candidatus Eremiobacteraeota bacterium]